MVGSDTPPRVPEEFVRYDENGTIPGSLLEGDTVAVTVHKFYTCNVILKQHCIGI